MFAYDKYLWTWRTTCAYVQPNTWCYMILNSTFPFICVTTRWEYSSQYLDKWQCLMWQWANTGHMYIINYSSHVWGDGSFQCLPRLWVCRSNLIVGEILDTILVRCISFPFSCFCCYRWKENGNYYLATTNSSMGKIAVEDQVQLSFEEHLKRWFESHHLYNHGNNKRDASLSCLLEY